MANTVIIGALADFAAHTDYEDLPREVVTTAKLVLLDTIGCALAGASTDPGKVAVSVARDLGGPAECVVLGAGRRVSVLGAVLANGQLANALDFDTVMPGGHTPPYIVPTTLAMAERSGSTGRELVVATAIGLEIAARLAAATPAPMQFVGEERAFRYAAREGFAKLNFGAAAGAGRLHGLGRDALIVAMAHAGHLSQLNTWTRGNHASPRNHAKYGFPGWQNTGAVLSVLFAGLGLTGDVELLDDREHGYGEFSGYESWDPTVIAHELGERWSFAHSVRFKPYACCTILHRGIEGFERILHEERLRPEEIDRVVVETSPTVEAPLFTDRSLRNTVDLQFSMPHVLAVVAYGQRSGADWQDEDTLADPRIADFAERVSIAANPVYAAAEESIVTVSARGRTYTERLAGGTEPMDTSRLVEKFRHNATRPLMRHRIDTAVDALLHLERVDDLRRLTDALM